MRVKLILLGVTMIAVGGAYAVTHRHPYKNHANDVAAASFATQACATNSIMAIVNAYPPANPMKAGSTPADEARRERLFRYDLPKLTKPMAESLRADASWDYLHNLGTRAAESSGRPTADADLRKELTLFSKEVAADLGSLCPRTLPTSAEDQPYVSFAIVTIIQSFGDPQPPPPVTAASGTTAH